MTLDISLQVGECAALADEVINEEVVARHHAAAKESWKGEPVIAVCARVGHTVNLNVVLTLKGLKDYKPTGDRVPDKLALYVDNTP